MPLINVTRTYLELTDRAGLHPARHEDPSLVLSQVADCPATHYRHLYGTVGAQYHWVDRRGWTDDQIRAWVTRPDVSIWELRQGAAEAGYFELAFGQDRSVEIAYFGLFPEFVGRGLGKHLLTVAVEQAWAMGARRVWLHTCTLDHPAALPNYIKRGFTPFRTEVYQAAVPA